MRKIIIILLLLISTLNSNSNLSRIDKETYFDEKEFVKLLKEEYKTRLSDQEFLNILMYTNIKCFKTGINLFDILATFARESGFNPSAIGTCGDKGLGQIIKQTSDFYQADYNKLLDPYYNIDITIKAHKYLKTLHNKREMYLVAYARGVGAIQYLRNNEAYLSDISLIKLNYEKKKIVEFYKKSLKTR